MILFTVLHNWHTCVMQWLFPPALWKKHFLWCWYWGKKKPKWGFMWSVLYQQRVRIITLFPNIFMVFFLHVEQICKRFWKKSLRLQVTHCMVQRRVANNFPAVAGQIIWSKLLGHITFLAGQTLITSYRYKSAPSTLHMMFKYGTSKLSKHLLYMSINLNAGKVECMPQQSQYYIFVQVEHRLG